MIKKGMFEIIRNLEFDNKKTIFKKDDVEIQLFRPSKLSARFKDYDLKKNFQIWLKHKEREFRPNHLRVFIDLNLRTRSRPDLKEKLLIAFDKIFYGKDPIRELGELLKENFEHFLNDLEIIGVLAQLFIIEQEYGYTRESKYEPATLFFQGWIRQFIDSPKEIDNLCMSVCNGQPPKASYVNEENKKGKKWTIKEPTPAWYIKKEPNNS